MPKTFANIHGRRQTRGLRPYLLIPKVLCVAGYFGGLLTMLVSTDASRIHRLIVLPSLIGAGLLGALLLALHGPILLRMRWLQVKLAAAVGLGLGHAWYLQGGGTGPVIGLLVGAGVVVWLGRHKPRLGQRIATVHQQRRMKEARS